MTAAPWTVHNTQVELPPKTRNGRDDRYQLRQKAARLLPGSRTASCGTAVATEIEIKVGDGTAHYVGVETCGSVWACPVCAAKIAEKRRQEIVEVCDKHSATGGGVYMVTLTVPHHRFQRPGDVRQSVADAWRTMQAGSPWRRFRDKWGVLGSVRSLEVTHGGNGWHPHLHVLLFADDLDAADVAIMGESLFFQWSSATARVGVGSVSTRGFRFERARKAEDAGNYVGKWGCDFEVAHGHAKTSVGATPWELLRRARRGDNRAASLFVSYARAFKGARQLTWSRNIRALYGVGDLSDDDAAAAVPVIAETVVRLSRPAYRDVRRHGLLAAVLTAAETGGVRAVADCMRDAGLDPGPVDYVTGGIGGDIEGDEIARPVWRHANDDE